MCNFSPCVKPRAHNSRTCVQADVQKRNGKHDGTSLGDRPHRFGGQRASVENRRHRRPLQGRHRHQLVAHKFGQRHLGAGHSGWQQECQNSVPRLNTYKTAHERARRKQQDRHGICNNNKNTTIKFSPCSKSNTIQCRNVLRSRQSVHPITTITRHFRRSVTVCDLFSCFFFLPFFM